MADNRSIVITLKIDNDTNATDTSNQTNTNKVSSKEDNDSNSKALAGWAVTQSMQVVASEVINWADYYWNKDIILNDDYIGQRSKQIATTQINRAINTISSVASTTMIGAHFGPVGAAIGFLIGAGTQVASIARSNIQGQQQQNIQIRQMNAQLDFTRSRAGWSTQAASIGEDL